jgi:hypothetical protein
MHIGGSLHRLRVGVRPIHLAEILASTADGPQQGTDQRRGLTGEASLETQAT